MLMGDFDLGHSPISKRWRPELVYLEALLYSLSARTTRVQDPDGPRRPPGLVCRVSRYNIMIYKMNESVLV